MSSLKGNPPTRAELRWVGSGAWCAYDSALAKDDARRVIAFLECASDHVDVVWVREHRPPDRFDSLRSALVAVELAMSP